MEKLAEEYAGKVKIAKLDVDANQQTARQFGIRSIPTVMVFRKGNVSKQLVGVRSIDDYRASLEKAVD